MEDIFNEIRLERMRQETLAEAGSIPHTCSSDLCSDLYSLSVLAEEMGEVAKEVQRTLPGENPELLIELVQVAAVCVAWLEKLKREK